MLVAIRSQAGRSVKQLHGELMEVGDLEVRLEG
jgi:hypothetical protein